MVEFTGNLFLEVGKNLSGFCLSLPSNDIVEYLVIVISKHLFRGGGTTLLLSHVSNNYIKCTLIQLQKLMIQIDQNEVEKEQFKSSEFQILTIYQRLINYFLQQISQKYRMIEQNQSKVLKEKITFLRHAQSLANKAVHDFREQRNLPDCWKTFHSIDEFNHKVIYNPDLCDCGISEKGQAQCLQVKQKLKDLKIDLILVSPLQRALETCEKVFGHKFNEVDIIVEPLLAQSMKYSSDISGRISEKQKRFPKYNFDNVVKEGDFWFIKNDNEQNQKLYFEHLDLFPHDSYEQKQREIAKFMYLKHLRQSNLNVRKRVQKIKELLKTYSKKYNNIVVVSHYYTIKHIMAKKVSSNGEPLGEFYGPNCCVHQQHLQNMFIQQLQK